MFTGLVREVGRISSIETTDEGSELVIESRKVGELLEIGASVSINGVCLTVEEKEGREFRLTATPETLRRTNLGELLPGAPVNLEPSLRPSEALGGHLVQGHVDATGTVAEMRVEGNSRVVRITAPRSVLVHCVQKGSISVDGVSLTISGLDDEGFEVTLIPHTVDVTRFSSCGVGDRVNLEIDIISKYVESHVQRIFQGLRDTDRVDPNAHRS